MNHANHSPYSPCTPDLSPREMERRKRSESQSTVIHGQRMALFELATVRVVPDMEVCGPCGVRVGSVWGPCGVRVGSVWGPCGSVWGPCGGHVGSGVRVGSMWGPCVFSRSMHTGMSFAYFLCIRVCFVCFASTRRAEVHAFLASSGGSIGGP